MEKVTLDTLMRRAISDPVFRHRLLVDPEVAVSEANWDLPPEDMAALKAWHDNMRHITKLEELERSLSTLVASRQPGRHS